MTKEEFIARMLRDAEKRALSDLPVLPCPEENDPIGEELPAEIRRCVAGVTGVKGEEDG